MPQDSSTYTDKFYINDSEYEIHSSHQLNLDSLIQSYGTGYQTTIPYTPYKDPNLEKPNMIPMYCFIFFFIVIFIWVITEVLRKFGYYTSNFSYTDPDYYETTPSSTPWDPTYDTQPQQKILTYYGNELNFSKPVLTEVLTKRFPYYNTLDGFLKDKFLIRLQKFIGSKTFYIHDESGFKEMPILISAAAIQLSFGFEKYLLPDFPYINIYPQEFLGVYPTIRYLEGNVSGNTINMSWKHFLDGFQCPNDGQNVGLHEMAHAYHFQNFETGKHEDQDFTSNFPKFNNYANKAFSQEALPGYDLYSDYALTNFQEFWAESVEIFFEKPMQLKATYPDLYIAMCDLMNQQPCK